MKTKFLSFVLSAIFCLPVFSQSVVPVNDAKQWMEQRFAKGVIPPFSFVYGGKNSDGFIRNWQYRSEKLSSDEPNVEKYVYSYADKATGLVVKCTVTCFADFPAVEWVLNFVNTSGKNTPLIEQVAAVDHSFHVKTNGDVVLHRSIGSDHVFYNFQPIDEIMQVGKNIYMTPNNRGCSSDGYGFPFFNIAMQGSGGVMVAVGWTGKWYANVALTDAKTLNLKSGMERMQLTLHPKEEIRTPKICLLFWKGDDRMTGHNQFRQFILAHHSRKINGQFAEYPLAACLRFGDEPFTHEWEDATEEYLVALVKRHQQFKIVPEVFWIDAGWYEGCGWEKEKGEYWQNNGNWIPDKERFPNGLRPVADAIHDAGAKFLLWFEPERVSRGSIWDRELHDWMLKLPDGDLNDDHYFYLYDLGNTDARIWLTDYISDFIKKEGIDVYRQDMNFDLYPYWIAKDQPGRIGISEIRHIEGLYAFWDSLLVRFPNLLIDNCASGGRRIDLETTSRSAPLWRSDYHWSDLNAQQCHSYGLNFYLPIHGSGAYITDDYTFRSLLNAAMVGQCWLKGRGTETVAASQKYMQKFKELRPYFYGDYYPLTSPVGITGNDIWLAYQMNRPKEKDGIIIAFRRADNQKTSIRIKPSGLEKDAVYELYDEDSETRSRMTGNDLMNGFDITITDKPGSLLIKYQKLN